MNDKKLDEDIKQTLLEHSDTMLEHKEAIWQNIEQELGIGEHTSQMAKEHAETMITRQQRQTLEKQKSKGKASKFIGWIIGGVAVASIIGIVTTTNTGQALVDNVKQFFEPEKKVVEEYEGMPEETEVVLQDTDSGYIIYVDEERYQLVKEEDQDIIVTKEPLDERYPEVSMSIKQVKGKLPEEVAKEVNAELVQQFSEVDEAIEVTEPLQGLMISAIDGSEWDSRVSRVYIVSNERGGSFVITEKYFLEASEGHGARFYHMLEQFEVVQKDPNHNS